MCNTVALECREGNRIVIRGDEVKLTSRTNHVGRHLKNENTSHIPTPSLYFTPLSFTKG
jgi:hypothetical protein